MARTLELNPEMGARAKARREALGLSKIEVAHRLGVGTGRLSQMEQYGIDGLAFVRRWAEAIETTPEYLAFGDGPETKKGKRR